MKFDRPAGTDEQTAASRDRTATALQRDVVDLDAAAPGHRDDRISLVLFDDRGRCPRPLDTEPAADDQRAAAGRRRQGQVVGTGGHDDGVGGPAGVGLHDRGPQRAAVRHRQSAPDLGWSQGPRAHIVAGVRVRGIDERIDCVTAREQHRRAEHGQHQPHLTETSPHPLPHRDPPAFGCNSPCAAALLLTMGTTEANAGALECGPLRRGLGPLTLNGSEKVGG